MGDSFEIKDQCLVIRVPNELDHHNALEVKEGADYLIERKNIQTVVFDFDRTNFMDSSGIGVIMGRFRKMNYLGGEVYAVNMKERVKKIFKISGLYKIIKEYDGKIEG